MKTLTYASFKSSIRLAFVPAVFVGMLTFILIGEGAHGAEQMDDNLVPSLFSSKLLTEDSISRLAELVLVVSAAIFSGMGGLFACAFILFRCQAEGDRTGSAQMHAPGPHPQRRRFIDRDNRRLRKPSMK